MVDAALVAVRGRRNQLQHRNDLETNTGARELPANMFAIVDKTVEFPTIGPPFRYSRSFQFVFQYQPPDYSIFCSALSFVTVSEQEADLRGLYATTCAQYYAAYFLGRIIIPGNAPKYALKVAKPTDDFVKSINGNGVKRGVYLAEGQGATFAFASYERSWTNGKMEKTTVEVTNKNIIKLRECDDRVLFIGTDRLSTCLGVYFEIKGNLVFAAYMAMWPYARNP